MKYLLVGIVVAATAGADLLQAYEMKRQGEVQSFSPTAYGRLVATIARKKRLIGAVGCMAVSFFAFLELLRIAELSFAVPASAATIVVETILAKLILKEKVAWQRYAGAVLVAAGVLLISL